MKKRFTLLLAATLMAAVTAGAADGLVRQTISLNQGWQFHYGEEHTGWQDVNLPHDYQISQPWVAPQAGERGNTTDLAANFRSTLSARAFKELGVGWYKKSLDIPASLKGQRLVLDFQGIMLVGDVYLNGERIGGTDYGYLGFEVDVTEKVKYGEANELMVRADTMGPFNSRWYTGGGLYRDVNLLVTPANGYFTRHPLYIRTTEVARGQAIVDVQAAIFLRSREVKSVKFGVRLLDADGKVVTEQTTETKYKNWLPGSNYDLEPLRVNAPHLWSCEDPYLYTVEVSLYDADGKVCDQVCEPFGIRTIEFGPSFGFKLNGEKVLLKGAANHHTLGPLGAAAFPRGEEYLLQMFKSFGFNHIRTSHNPYSESFLRLCDKMGILVVDELYDKWNMQYAGGRRDWKALWQENVEEWVKRDRNHPCVVMWSFGNELQQNPEPYGDFGVTAYRLQRQLLFQYDRTRPTTVAMHPRYRNWETDTLPCDLAMATDVASYNYRYMYFPGDSKNFPWMMFYQSEANSTGLPGNWFGMDLNKVIGLAYWGAIDYLGESAGWPAKGFANGEFDISGEPKPIAYLIKSYFSEEPVVHIGIIERPTENYEWNGMTVGSTYMSENWNRTAGEKVNLWTYTNGDEVELFVGGKSQGVKKNDISNPNERNRIRWNDIPYKSGSIEAVARKDGRVIARHKIETVGKPVALRVEPVTTGWKAGGQDLQYVRVTAVDSRGRRVWTAGDKLRFDVAGPACVAGVCSGNIYSEEIHTDPEVQLFQGTAVVILRSGTEPGAVTLTVSSPGFKKPVALPLATK
jgi:beta-galactosidase